MPLITSRIRPAGRWKTCQASLARGLRSQGRRHYVLRIGWLKGLLALVLVAGSAGGTWADPSSPAAVPPGESAAYDWVDLYFGHANGRNLEVEARRLALPADTAQRARTLVEAWIEGPRKRRLVPVIPRETRVRAVYVARSGIAYVDFESALRQLHSGGCQSELLTIYGLVNSLVLNIPQISRVKILLGGEEAVTLAGHVLLQEPFTTDLLLVR